MEERLTETQIDILCECIRRGKPLPKKEREMYSRNVAALLKMSDVYLDTCQFLSAKCEEKMKKYEARLSDRWLNDATEELQWWWAWTQKLRHEGKLKNWENLKAAPFPFEPYVGQFPEGEIHVLNIGSGPRSIMGERSVSSDRISFTHMDPLADAYNKLMGLLDAPGTGDIVFGAVEFLTELKAVSANRVGASA